MLNEVRLAIANNQTLSEFTEMVVEDTLAPYGDILSGFMEAGAEEEKSDDDKPEKKSSKKKDDPKPDEDPVDNDDGDKDPPKEEEGGDDSDDFLNGTIGEDDPEPPEGDDEPTEDDAPDIGGDDSDDFLSGTIGEDEPAEPEGPVDDGDPMGTPGNIEDVVDDILSLQIDMKTNTISDIAPQPPEGAEGSVGVVPPDMEKEDFLSAQIESTTKEPEKVKPDTSHITESIKEKTEDLFKEFNEETIDDGNFLSQIIESGPIVPEDDKSESPVKKAIDKAEADNEKDKEDIEKIKKTIKESADDFMSGKIGSDDEPVTESGELDDFFKEAITLDGDAGAQPAAAAPAEAPAQPAAEPAATPGDDQTPVTAAVLDKVADAEGGGAVVSDNPEIDKLNKKIDTLAKSAIDMRELVKNAFSGGAAPQ
jgi:hypothetical protein